MIVKTCETTLHAILHNLCTTLYFIISCNMCECIICQPNITALCNTVCITVKQIKRRLRKQYSVFQLSSQLYGVSSSYWRFLNGLRNNCRRTRIPINIVRYYFGRNCFWLFLFFTTETAWSNWRFIFCQKNQSFILAVHHYHRIYK